jgi:hypothetical protein
MILSAEALTGFGNERTSTSDTTAVDRVLPEAVLIPNAAPLRLFSTVVTQTSPLFQGNHINVGYNTFLNREKGLCYSHGNHI